jgi:hypothetical protein
MAQLDEEQNGFITFTQEGQYYDLCFNNMPSTYVIAEQEGWRLFNHYSKVGGISPLSPKSNIKNKSPQTHQIVAQMKV